MFVNKGDVNFFEYGRIVEDTGDGCFTIISCDPMYDDNAGKYLFSISVVDITDDWIDQASVFDFAGTGEDCVPIDYALDVLSYYGSQEFGDQGAIMAEEEIKDLLDHYQADFEESPWHYNG